MPRAVVANELSFVGAPDRYAARARMEAFLRTVVGAFDAGAERRLRTAAPLGSLQLAPGYSLVQWRNDNDVDRDARTRFKSLQINSPPIDAEDGRDVADRLGGSEYRYKGQLAVGLGASALLQGLAVSLASSEDWSSSNVALEEAFVLGDDLLRQDVLVPHASSLAHVHAHKLWLAEGDVVPDADDLWARRQELFPHLVFCADVQKQLREIDRGSPMLHQVVSRLRLLETYFAAWDGMFRAEGVGVKTTRESTSTMEQFSSERTIVCPDGQSRLFEWHVRMTPGKWRMYFQPGPKSAGAFIGYIGPKPPTTLYRT